MFEELAWIFNMDEGEVEDAFLRAEMNRKEENEDELLR